MRYFRFSSFFCDYWCQYFQKTLIIIKYSLLLWKRNIRNCPSWYSTLFLRILYSIFARDAFRYEYSFSDYFPLIVELVDICRSSDLKFKSINFYGGIRLLLCILYTICWQKVYSYYHFSLFSQLKTLLYHRGFSIKNILQQSYYCQTQDIVCI